MLACLSVKLFMSSGLLLIFLCGLSCCVKSFTILFTSHLFVLKSLKSCSVMACVWGPSRSILGWSCENLYRLIKYSLICVKIRTVLLNTCLLYGNPYRLAQYSSVCVKILILLFNTFMFVRKSLPPCSIFSCLCEKSHRLLNRLWLQIYLWFIECTRFPRRIKHSALY